MDKFIVNSSAAYPLGIPTGRKVLMVINGPYSRRLAILYAASASDIALVWADPPYDSFSTPVNVVTDSADTPFDVHMNDSGDVFLAYTTASGSLLHFVKLTFGNGVWTTGTPIVVYDAEPGYYPCIGEFTDDSLWIAYTRVSGGSSYISCKASADGGASWGTTSDPGDTLTSGSSSAFALLLRSGEYQYLFFTDGGTKIAYRRKIISGVVWNSEVVLSSGEGFDEHFAADSDADGRIGLAYACSSGLKFREYTGSAWTAETLLDAGEALCPTVSYQGGIPYVFYHISCGDNMHLVMYTRRIETDFQSPAPLDPRKSYLDKLLVYDASAGTYQDKTSVAASIDTADILHSNSGALLGDTGDALFVGVNAPFNFLRLNLSTAGSGGEVVWKYWDGQAWKSFTPSSGVWHFTSTGHDLLLWNDYLSIPTDWQKKTISSNNLYWISIEVVAPFSTSPVGTQITAVSNLNALSVQV